MFWIYRGTCQCRDQAAGEITHLQAKPQIWLVRSIPAHCLGVGHDPEPFFELYALDLVPNLADDGLYNIANLVPAYPPVV